MKSHVNRIVLGLAGLLATTVPALAHVGTGAHDGFAHGFMHPFNGLDHLLAMIGVGLFAAQLGSRALWLVPSAFVSMMVAGGVLGFNGMEVPFVELGIVASVVAIGVLLAFNVQLPLAIAMALTGVFAVFHGYAHGAELPPGNDAVAYVGGFVLATALLHVFGVGIGLAFHKLPSASRVWVDRAMGGAMTIVGLVLLS